MRIGLFTSAAILTLGTGFASAQPSETETGRYVLEKTETGFIRLDKQTGSVSFCREDRAELTCRVAADERAAYDQELDMLAKRVEALEAQVGRQAPQGSAASEAEIEHSLSIMERFMRRFMGLVEEFRQDGASQPDRS